MSQTLIPDSGKLSHVTCNTLLLATFERCLIYGDLSVLGDASPEERQRCWEQVFTEYITLIRDDGAIQMLLQTTIVHEANLHIALVTALLLALESMYNERIAGMIREHYDFRLTKDTYKKDIERIATLVKQKALDRDEALKAIEEYGQNQEDGEKIDGTYFDVALVRYSAIRGYRVSKREVTVQEFCIMMRELQKEAHLKNIDNG